MAINILLIPAISANPERVFSRAYRTVSWERIKLGSESIEKTECLKSWIRSNLAIPVSGDEE